MVGCGSHGDNIEGRLVGPTTISIARSDLDILVAQVSQPLASFAGQLVNYLDAINALDQFGQDGGGFGIARG